MNNIISIRFKKQVPQNCGKNYHGFSHTSMLVRKILEKNKTVIMPQPPYSPDLAPAEFFLFPKLKTTMKGKRFATIEEIKEKSKQELLAIASKGWHKCIISEGNYFERDKIVIDESGERSVLTLGFKGVNDSRSSGSDERDSSSSEHEVGKITAA